MIIVYYGLLVMFIGLLVAISVIDIRTMEIPNQLVVAVLAVGFGEIIFFQIFRQYQWDTNMWLVYNQLSITLLSRLIGVFCVSVPLLLITLFVPDAFGGGDIKLMAAAGLYLGYQMTLVSFVLAIISGGAYGIYLLLTKKKDRKAHFAFGPFLCFGMVVSALWGWQLLTWYLTMLM